MLELLTKLRPGEARQAVIYFDGLSRLAELERRYGAAHAKLVELTSKVADPAYKMHIEEVANHVHGYLTDLIGVGEHFIQEARKLRRASFLLGCKPGFVSGG